MTPAGKNKKNVFTVKTFQLSDAHSMLVGMEGSGILKIRYTKEFVVITIWDDKCENILHELTCSHEQMRKEIVQG